MPVYPVEVLPPTFRGAYPHLQRHDAKIWERFLDTYAESFTGFAYDVALGGVVVDEDQGDEPTRKAWQYSTAMKVDVVGFRAEAAWIIEVKAGAHAGSVGQPLCYVELGEVDRFTDLELIPVLVTDRASPDLRFCAERLGVLLFELPEEP